MILTVTLNPCVDKTIFVRNDKRGQIVQAERIKQIAGGKGINVSKVIGAMGIATTALLVVGGHYGELIVQLGRAEGIDLLPVRVSEPSRNVVTILEEFTGISTAYVEPGPRISWSERQSITDCFLSALPDAEYVVLSGSVPCDELNDIYRDFLEVCRERRIPAVLDTRGDALRNGIPGRPYLLKPNLAEAERLLGRRIAGEADAIDAVMRIHQLGVDSVVLSLGEKGAIALAPGHKRPSLWRLVPPKVVQINPVGSGDSMVGALVAQLYRSLPFELALRYGGAAGAANAAMWDAASCTSEQIEALVNQTGVEAIPQVGGMAQ